MVYSRSLRLALAALTVLAGSLVGVAATPIAANAAITPDSSGGGCAPGGTEGVVVSSCISASGANLEPDTYITKDPGCYAAELHLIDYTAGAMTIHPISCATGHQGPFPTKGTNGHTYRNITVIYLSDGDASSIESPALTFSN
ncbi:hypothetical protein [Streptomyces sp. NPDC051572]|uniref:hypothetical protein n=1 Tax=Streptomyces sp. NPDC051572 TaxID=3155802 RepID=UPI00344E6A55